MAPPGGFSSELPKVCVGLVTGVDSGSRKCSVASRDQVARDEDLNMTFNLAF